MIARAGEHGAVTISTQMSGRGTDIRLGGSDEHDRRLVVAAGGLAVIATALYPSRRLDQQLRGRAGRQGDPGVTVTRSRGTARTPSGSVTVTDLPGTYSLEPASPDEEVVLDHLHGRLDSDAAPDALLVVMDSTTLYRSLGLCAEALALGRPTAVVLTMVDELRARGGDVDISALSRALGVPVGRVRLAGFVIVTVLCGAATGALGPITFIGLMVPHAVRMLFGPDNKWLIPTTMLVGPIVMVGSDLIARIATPNELPVGMITAFIGAPVLIYLVRRKGVSDS